MIEDTYKSVPQAAIMLGVSEQRVRALISDGRFEQAQKAGRDWMIPIASIKQYIAGKAKKEVE